MKRKYSRMVIVEVHNGGSGIEKLVSNFPITLESAVKYYETKRDFNFWRDSIIFIDAVETICIDK